MGDCRSRFDHVGPADHFIESTEAKPRHDLPRLLSNKKQVVHDVLGLAMKLLSQLGVLRCNPHRTGVQVTLTHHDAAQRDQRCRRKSDFFGTEQRPDHDVATCLDAAVCLEGHSTAKIIHHQGLVGFCKTQLPGQPRVLDTGQRGSAGAPGISGNENVIGMGLRHTCRNRSHAHLSDQFHADTRLRIRIF